MSEYNAKNYGEQGGEKMVIGGRLEIAPGGVLMIKSGATFTDETAAAAETIKIPYLANSTQSSATNVVKDLNALLTLMRGAGLMDAEAPTITITAQPQPVTVNVNGNISLTISASSSDGRALAFQWYSNAADSNTGGTTISGATNASYAAPTNAAGTVYYYCVVSDGSGAATESVTPVISNAASVAVS